MFIHRPEPYVNLRSIDLNLLVVFEALIEERGVTRAAARLGITQSAVSHALKRLRIALNDDLLVRVAGAMEPTPQAIKLAAAFKGALTQIEDVLTVQRDFNPATARRTFHLSVSDYVGGQLLPRLCTHLRHHAPDIGLAVEPLDGVRTSDLVAYEGLEVRLSVGKGSPIPSASLRLLDDRFVVLMRRDHPAASRPFTLDAYLAQPQVKVTGVGSNIVDDTLATDGRMRRVMVRVPSWQGMVEVIEQTDLVGAIPAHWMPAVLASGKCVTRPMPLGDMTLAIDAVWHPRNNDDAGHQWFRKTVHQMFDPAVARIGSRRG